MIIIIVVTFIIIVIVIIKIITWTHNCKKTDWLKALDNPRTINTPENQPTNQPKTNLRSIFF